MMQAILNDLTRYLDFLRKTGLFVSICRFDEVFSPCLSTLFLYEIHTPAVCHAMKNRADTRRRCIRHKHTTLCRHEALTPFYGGCWAGVEEFVFPVVQGEKVLMYLNVTGFRGQSDTAHLRREKFLKKNPEFLPYFRELSDDVPTVDELLPALRPLRYMIFALADTCRQLPCKTDESDRICRQIVEFLCENYADDLSAVAISEAIGYSVSYVQHLFRQKSGETIGQFLQKLRLKKAAELLRTTSLPIIRIAADTGFCDQNYFSVCFKKAFSVSPKEYRKR